MPDQSIPPGESRQATPISPLVLVNICTVLFWRFTVRKENPPAHPKSYAVCEAPLTGVGDEVPLCIWAAMPEELVRAACDDTRGCVVFVPMDLLGVETF